MGRAHAYLNIYGAFPYIICDVRLQAIRECPGTACDTMLEEQWTSIIKQIRNYPCVFDYTMDNEKDSLHDPFASDLYTIAKTLDPTR